MQWPVPAAVATVLFALATPLVAQNRSEDEYTRYELLAPETSSFKIIYDVTAVIARREVLLQSDQAGQRRH